MRDNKKVVMNIGVFLVFMMFSWITLSFFSPIVKTNADTVEVDALINSIASLRLDKESLSFNITPSAPGVFSSQSIAATVSTNSTKGYELYFSSVDNETDMVNTNSSVSSTITSGFDGTVTSSTMAKNTWGYSLDEENYSKIPTLSDQAILRNLNTYPTEVQKTTTVHIGINVSSNIPSGIYTKAVTFSVIAHPVEPTPTEPDDITTIDEMQDMTEDICAATKVGAKTTLTDTRDGNTYTVSKLADGNCWMTQNLRIIDTEISSEDSNLPAGETFTIPASHYVEYDSFENYDNNEAYYSEEYGGYYSFYTATAGWGTESQAGTAPKDICPKGWRLPTGGVSENGEIIGLYYAYLTTPALVEGDFKFTRGGKIQFYMSNVGTNGYIWSSTVSKHDSVSNHLGLVLGVESGTIPLWYDAGYSKFDGLGVRCMVADNSSKTIEDISYMQDMSKKVCNNTATGKIAILTDTRDNNTYTVAKLNDGNCWMTENLRLNGTTITDSDSDIYASSFTVPDSNWTANAADGYNSPYTYNTGNNDYGVYYNTTAASAGTITGDSTYTAISASICPKGWKLPSDSDYSNLKSSYSVTNDMAGSLIMQGSPLNFKYSGYIGYDSSAPAEQGASGIFLETGAYEADSRITLKISDSGVDPYNGPVSRKDGVPLRCVAR